jgi:excisionase family DNA binding protein
MTSNVLQLSPHAAGDGRGRSDLHALDGLPLLIPVPMAAKLLGLPRSTAYHLAESGELPSRRLGGRVYVVTAKLRQLIEAA